MRYLYSMALVLVLLAVGPGPLRAADAPPAKLSVVDAVATALGINTRLQQSQQAYQTSLSRLRIAGFTTTYGLGSSAGLEKDPENSSLSSRIFGSLSYTGLLGTQVSLEMAPFGTGSKTGYIGLSLRHPLLQGKGTLSEKANLLLAAQSNANVLGKEYYLDRQSTVLEVVTAYYRAVEAIEQVKIQERAVTLSEEAATAARKRLDAGLTTKMDLSRAEIALARSRNQLSRQNQFQRQAMDRLMLAIGAGVGQNSELTDQVPEMTAELPQLPDALKTALANRTELAISDEELTNQARILSLAEDRLRPKLDVVAGFDYSNKDNGMLSSSFFHLGSMAAGLEMRFPLDKRIDLEERATAARELDLLRKERAYKAETIAEQVRNAYRSVETARATLQIYGDNMKVAEDALSNAKRMVDEGLADNRNVLEAQTSITDLQSGLLSAKVDLYLAYINLKYAQGEDLTAMVAK